MRSSVQQFAYIIFTCSHAHCEELFLKSKIEKKRAESLTSDPAASSHKPRPSAERTGAPFKQTKLGAPGGDSRCRRREGGSTEAGVKETPATFKLRASGHTRGPGLTDTQPEPHTHTLSAQSASRRLTANSTNMASASYHISNLLEKMTSSDKDFR